MNGRWASALVLLLACGCSGKAELPPRQRVAADAPGVYQTELVGSIGVGLNQIEDFEVSKQTSQLVVLLSAWAREQKDQPPWQPSPLVKTLPAPLQSAPGMKSLETLDFSAADLQFIKQAVWLRDIGPWATRGQFGDLNIARQLFDWTIRNIQLESEPKDDERLPRHPRDVLRLGRGRAIERAWVFALLARHRSLEVVLLAVGEPDERRRWLPALVGEKQELYLFDAELGLPLPGPDGDSVATLEQVADDGLLRKLDLDAEHAYPLTASDFAQVDVYLEATPESLSRRMALLDARLPKRRRMILAASPDATARRLASAAHVREVRLWPHPFEVATAPPLGPQGKEILASLELPFQFKVTLDVLETDPELAAEGKLKKQDFYTIELGRWRHLRGRWEGTRGATRAYLMSRTTKERIEAMTDPEERRLAVAAKQAASYWLGLLAFDEQQYATAIDYLATRTLDAFPGTSWTDGARYNLARAYEAAGQSDKAIALYEADDSPQRHGNRLRGRRLKERASSKSNDAP
jgi:hypothetical protein